MHLQVFDWELSVMHEAETWPHSGLLYDTMAFLSDLSKMRWIILAALVFFFYYYGWKKILIPLLIAGACAGLGDLISYRIIKYFVRRPRPHYYGQICDMSSCWGFVSSHATNVTAAATFLVLNDIRNLIWAIPVVVAIGFSRIYLLDHFPLDVIGGVITGTIIGSVAFCIYSYFKKKTSEASPKSQ